MVHRTSIRVKLAIVITNPKIDHRTHLRVLRSRLMLAKMPYCDELVGSYLGKLTFELVCQSPMNLLQTRWYPVSSTLHPLREIIPES